MQSVDFAEKLLLEVMLTKKLRICLSTALSTFFRNRQLAPVGTEEAIHVYVS